MIDVWNEKKNDNANFVDSQKLLPLTITYECHLVCKKLRRIKRLLTFICHEKGKERCRVMLGSASDKIFGTETAPGAVN